MGKTIGIIDYGMGNLKSVFNAFTALGASPAILESPAALADVSHVVLPGVGAFGDGMANLRRNGWIPAMERVVLEGRRPFLGICLGMQLLATRGEEHGNFEGLNWIKGAVIRLQDQGGTLRIPHIGWDDAVPVSDRGVYKDGIAKGGVFYFVHSYHFQPEQESVVDGWCDYGQRFAASIAQDNVWAVQYHPEKSQKAGLQVLKNFIAQD